MKKYRIIDRQDHHEVRDENMTEKDVIGFAFELIKSRFENAERDDEWANEDLKPIVEKGEENLPFQQAKYWLEDWWKYGVEEMK